MRRIRLGTTMLLIVIAALMMALVIQHGRASRRIAELEALVKPSWQTLSESRIAGREVAELRRRVKDLESELPEDR